LRYSLCLHLPKNCAGQNELLLMASQAQAPENWTATSVDCQWDAMVIDKSSQSKRSLKNICNTKVAKVA
jgi:hypothetical protein